MILMAPSLLWRDSCLDLSIYGWTRSKVQLCDTFLFMNKVAHSFGRLITWPGLRQHVSELAFGPAPRVYLAISFSRAEEESWTVVGCTLSSHPNHEKRVGLMVFGSWESILQRLLAFNLNFETDLDYATSEVDWVLRGQDTPSLHFTESKQDPCIYLIDLSLGCLFLRIGRWPGHLRKEFTFFAISYSVNESDNTDRHCFRLIDLKKNQQPLSLSKPWLLHPNRISIWWKRRDQQSLFLYNGLCW